MSGRSRVALAAKPEGGHSRGGTLAAAGRQTIVPMATTVTRSARSSRSARGARRRRCRLDENARNAVRVVRVRRGLRGGRGGTVARLRRVESKLEKLSTYTKVGLVSGNECSGESVRRVSQSRVLVRAEAPRPGCRARRRAWFSRGRTRKARSPTTTSGWMTSRTRLAPGRPRARRRRGVVPGFALGDASRVPGSRGVEGRGRRDFCRVGGGYGRARRARWDPADAAPDPRRRRDGRRERDDEPSAIARPPSSRRRCREAATVARRRDARRARGPREHARAETPGEDRERGVRAFATEHVAGEAGRDFPGVRGRHRDWRVQDISAEIVACRETCGSSRRPARSRGARVPNSAAAYRGTCTRSTRGGSRPSRRPPERERERRTVR